MISVKQSEPYFDVNVYAVIGVAFKAERIFACAGDIFEFGDNCAVIAANDNVCAVSRNLHCADVNGNKSVSRAFDRYCRGTHTESGIGGRTHFESEFVLIDVCGNRVFGIDDFCVDVIGVDRCVAVTVRSDVARACGNLSPVVGNAFSVGDGVRHERAVRDAGVVGDVRVCVGDERRVGSKFGISFGREFLNAHVVDKNAACNGRAFRTEREFYFNGSVGKRRTCDIEISFGPAEMACVCRGGLDIAGQNVFEFVGRTGVFIQKFRGCARAR